MTRSFNRFVLVALGAAALAAAASVGYWFGQRGDAVSSATVPGERKVLYWHDPMVPGYRSDKPGKSPFMDMDLVAVYAEPAGGAGADAPTVVAVRPEVLSNLGVRTYTVTRQSRARVLSTHGYVFRASGGGGYRVLVDILDRDVDWVRPGQRAEVRLGALPGKRFEAVVDALQSDIDVGARSVKAQLRLRESDPALQRNMFAEVTIHSPPQAARLMVPSEAVIRTGARTAAVLALGGGRFQPAEIVTGAESGEWIEVRSGLKEGDTVVVSGQFLIDSESSLRASFARMGQTGNGAGTPAPPPTGDHGGHGEPKQP